MKAALKNITETMSKEYGINVSVFEDSFLMKSIKRRMATTESATIGDYSRMLKSERKEVDNLYQALNINFSEFFRNPLTFAILEQIILPLISERKKRTRENEIRIWSAACASGQEAYSIAMLLNELVSITNSSVSYRIFATDINESVIATAMEGVFQSGSIGKVSYSRVQTYFTHKSDTFKVKTDVKSHIDFSVFDLLSDQGNCPPASIYGNFDMVICSNILFYYKEEFRHQILQKVINSIAPQGFLVCGETEREIIREKGIKEVYFNSGIFKL